MITPIKVLIVDDSALIRQLLSRALVLDPRIDIVGFAKDGVEAIEKAYELQPDVITLDIEMPHLTGLEALPHIVRKCDARIVMLSTLDDPDTTYQALSLGAADFISKPKSGLATTLSELAELLIKKIKVAYRIDPETMRRAQEAVVDYKMATEVKPSPEHAGKLDSIVSIASSTGGPPALETVFSGLTADLPAAYLLVQHLPPGFSDSLGRRISRVTDISIVEATDGMRVDPGFAYLAPHGAHMTVYGVTGANPRLALDHGDPVNGVRPAADPMMRTVAEAWPHNVGVILTGMGRDGVEGLSAIRAKGGTTIVQDESTSVVWGMPGAAVNAGVADRVIPIQRVAMEIRRCLRGGGES